MSTKIFLYCVPLGTGSGFVQGSLVGGDVMGYSVAEDGTGIASHLSSNKEFSKHDMGLTSNQKHEYYQKAFPDGYELEWVDDVENHAGLREALRLNNELYNKALHADRSTGADKEQPDSGCGKVS